MMSMAGDAVLLSSAPTSRRLSLRQSFLSQFLNDTKGAVLASPTSYDVLVHDIPSTIIIERAPKEPEVSSEAPSAKQEPTFPQEPLKEVSQNTQQTTANNNSNVNDASTQANDKARTEKRKRRSSSSSSKKNEQESETQGFALAEMAEAQAQMCHWEAAFELWEQALQVQRRAHGDRHLIVGQTLSRRGLAYAKLGLTYLSILDLEKSFHIQQGTNADDPNALLSMADTLLALAQVQQLHGSYVEAMRSLQQCTSLTQKVYGEKHERVARLVCKMGKFHHQRRRYKDALEYYEKGLALYEKAGFSKQHKHVVWVSKCIADRNMIADGFLTGAREAGDYR